jgi:hypothetical protein
MTAFMRQPSITLLKLYFEYRSIAIGTIVPTQGLAHQVSVIPDIYHALF